MKKNLHYRRWTIHHLAGVLLLASLLITGCANPKKIMESGNYDHAIQVATKRIKGKDEFKLKHVLVIEEAFAKAHAKDKRKVDALKNENRPENWTTIHSIYERMYARQRRIEPFLPVYAENGYRAEFKFVKVEPLLVEAKAKAAEYHYVTAIDLIENAKYGDREDAREAYSILHKIDRYYDNYKNTASLKKEARYLGTEQWLIRMANNTQTFLPERFEHQLLGIGSREFDQTWRQFSTRKNDAVDYDFEVTMVLDDIRVSPEIEKERQFDESLEIEDGFDYVLDENGNVMKDTLGNDIKVPKYTWISATVLEIYQSKNASIQGRLMIRDAKSKDILHSENVYADHNFENYASRLIRGDRRALTKNTKSRLGNAPRPFPGNEEMLLDAVDALKSKLRNFLRGPHV